MKKNYITRLIILFIFFFSFFLVGCGTIPDENGDEDISLVHISREMIIKKSNRVFGKYFLSCKSAKSCAGRDGHLFSIEMNNFSGVKSVYKFKLFQKDIHIGAPTTGFDYYYKVYEGNLNVIIISDGEYYTTLTANNVKEYNSHVVLHLGSNYTIVVAGESAKFEFYID